MRASHLSVRRPVSVGAASSFGNASSGAASSAAKMCMFNQLNDCSQTYGDMQSAPLHTQLVGIECAAIDGCSSQSF